MTSKAVRFDYFKVYHRYFDETKNDVKETLCDLTAVLTALQSKNTLDRNIKYFDEESRLQEINCFNNRWELHFLRVRNNNFPLVAHADGNVGYLDSLAENDGLGEDTSVLFDPQNCVIMIRRNKDSLPPSSISEFFTKIINQVGTVIFFKPLVHPDAISLLKKEHLIRKVQIGVADVKNASEKTKASLGSIISKAETSETPIYFNFSLGVPQKGSKKYSEIPIYEETLGFLEDPNVVSAEVRIKANQDALVETVDLIEQRIYSYSTFNSRDYNEDARKILHSTVINKMHLIYDEKVEEINKLFK